MDLPVLMPVGVADVHVVPLLVRTLPDVPGDVSPVPPDVAGKTLALDHTVPSHTQVPPLAV